MKVIISGGRYFTDYNFVKKHCDILLDHIQVSAIVSGGARGVDALGEKYAEEKGYVIKLFPANWKKYGDIAGPIRNTEMADYSDMLIAFWNGKSKGTANMIKMARVKGIPVHIVRYDESVNVEAKKILS